MPGESVDLVLTDPPYGIEFRIDRKVARALDTRRGIANDDSDNTPLLQTTAFEAFRVLRPDRHLYWFTRWDRLEYHLPVLRDAGFRVVNCLVWDKAAHGMGDLDGAFAPQYECIVFCQKGRRPLFEVGGTKRHPDILRYNTVGRMELRHSHEKPLGLIALLVGKSTHPGELVVDPFLGSGTTAEACLRLGRDFIGWELDPRFVQMAKERTAQMQLPWIDEERRRHHATASD